MSKIIRKQLFEILETLDDAVKMIQNSLEKITAENLTNLLADCQDCSIAIGTKIEKIYPKATGSVQALEIFCEELYQFSKSCQTDTASEEITEKLAGQLSMIRQTMEKEISDKKEVVFFPYKASMWDSLESVYLKAREDEECEAYCVPIPYFDKNPDGSPACMHYEIDEYPENIDVIDWQEYELEERMPDVAYIHNPYDDGNFVTSVHPRFFSSNLKKYVNELVYIPYFILKEIEPDDQKSIDEMKHFCFLPGTVYADKVILQSENMRQIYINEYIKAAKEHGLAKEFTDRKKVEKKFWGLGSPKFDKILNTKKEEIKIPEEWLKIIQKKDGSRKKIVFYNTTIGALLQHNEKMLEQITRILELFKRYQKNVTLLWRPHPLLAATIQSMRPRLWQQYRKITEEYRAENWGIYDDSSDLNRAIIISDMYYGDASSVIHLFIKMKKMYILQHVGIEPQLRLIKQLEVN